MEAFYDLCHMMEHKVMKIAILGTGGVGGYFGGKLAKAGYEVTFLARGAHLDAIRKNGLQIKSSSGDFSIHPVRITDRIAEIGTVDLIILGVKAWQVKEMAREMKRILTSHTTVLPLQNGVLAMDELAGELDSQHIAGGLCRIFSKIESPGVISHMGVEPVILFGEKDNRPSERMLQLKEVFDRSGIKARIAENIQVEIWKKFISICASGLLAVTRSTYGEIRELKETRGLMIELFQEIYVLSQKMGIGIEQDFVEKTISFIDTFPFDSTSSLTRDVWEGKPSEIEYQNGTVVKLGQKLGVNTPVNRFVYDCILPMELRARKKYKG
jgi:2-dehydropantoate 2-reductase